MSNNKRLRNSNGEGGRWADGIYTVCIYCMEYIPSIKEGPNYMHLSVLSVLQNLENPISMVQIKWDEVAPSTVSEL